MEVKLVRGLLNLMTGFVIGMVVMSGFYCNALNITSGPMYIDWVTIAIVVFSLIGVHLIVHFDPSFSDGWKEHAEEHYKNK